MTTHTTFQLARLADCGDPDVPDFTSFDVPDAADPDAPEPSPGARFLHSVAVEVPNVRERVADGEDLGDVIHEVADAEVPIYTHQRWATFVDLAAYQEDLSEWSDTVAVDDLERGVAGVALYMIAARLLYALVEDDESDDDADDESDD